MEKLELLVNNKIEIIWNREAYKSTIQDIQEECFSISIPTKDGEYIPLKAGDTAEVLYYFDLNIFQFDSIVKGRTVDGIPLILLEIPEKYTVVQRRQYFRVNKFDFFNISTHYKFDDKNPSKTNDGNLEIKNGDNIFNRAVLLDLSGGGMKIKLEEKVSQNDVLHFYLKTPKEDIELYGKIVRVERDELNAYICGICFLDLTQKVREKIIQYTFELIREQRRKGL